MQFKKVSVIDSESQAKVLHQALEDRGIPHVIKSYHDSAYDGLYQLGRGWGQIDASDEFRNEIIAIIQELNQPLADQGEAAGPA